MTQVAEGFLGCGCHTYEGPKMMKKSKVTN